MRALSIAPLAKSRGIVVHLATLFSLDAFGGGFVIQSLLALWLFRRFNMSVRAAGVFFFAAGLLGSLSQFVSVALAARIGRIRRLPDHEGNSSHVTDYNTTLSS